VKAGDHRQRRVSVLSLTDDEAFRLQQSSRQPPGRGMVIDDQQRGPHTRIVAPPAVRRYS
jgi:hypothetical protein